MNENEISKRVRISIMKIGEKIILIVGGILKFYFAIIFYLFIEFLSVVLVGGSKHRRSRRYRR